MHSDFSPLSQDHSTRRRIGAIFGATFCELVAVFMLSPLLLLTLKQQQHPTWLAGLFAASGWAGILCIMPWAHRLTRRLGRDSALQWAAFVPLMTLGGFYLTDSLAMWFGLQMLAGMAAGLRWVLAEAMVAESAPPHQRGRFVGLFETMVGATFVLGPGLLAVLGPHSPVTWGCMAVLMTVAWVWSLCLPRSPEPASADAQDDPDTSGLLRVIRQHPILMAAGFLGGFFESGLSSMLPLYGLSLGWSEAQAALLVSVSGLGSSVLMWPAGELADRLAQDPRQRWGSLAQSRRWLMRACAGATALTCLSLFAIPFQPLWAWPAMFMLGGVGGCLYTLSMVDIGDREQGNALVCATSVLVMSYTLGSGLSPALGGWALDTSPQWGPPALLLGVACAGMAIFKMNSNKTNTINR